MKTPKECLSLRKGQGWSVSRGSPLLTTHERGPGGRRPPGLSGLPLTRATPVEAAGREEGSTRGTLAAVWLLAMSTPLPGVGNL